MSTIRARFDGEVFVPLDPVHFPTDRLLKLEVRDAQALDKGSPRLVSQAMREPPHVSHEDVDALERTIEEGRAPRDGGDLWHVR